MNEVTQVIIWWVGAHLCIAILGCLSWGMLLWLEAHVARRALHIARLVTVRYWIDRMEREGLTVCMKDYRKMVADRKPKGIVEFRDIGREWEMNRGEQTAQPYTQAVLKVALDAAKAIYALRELDSADVPCQESWPAEFADLGRAIAQIEALGVKE